MQVGAQFPISSEPSGSRNRFPVVAKQNTKSTSSDAIVQPSSVAQFEEASAQNEPRFSRYGDFDANAKAALSSYQATELLATNNPRQQLIGVDVFA